MLERLKYKNHLNEVIDFGISGIYVNIGELHDYDWTVRQKNNKITSLRREVVNRKLPVVIICDTEEEGIATRNRMMEVFEKDVLALQHGRIIIGDYYFRCFVTKSKKDDYLYTKRHMTLDLTLTSDFPYWVKETLASFSIVDPGSSDSSFLDFDYDFQYDYTPSTENSTIINPGFAAANFKMNIYGACSDPAVFIAGHEYNVTCDINANEYLTIDSVNKTITKTASDGTVTNLFSNRNKASYIFEKIPIGASPVMWDGDFGFDILLFEERSEPKWT